MVRAKSKLIWKNKQQATFDEIKQFMSKERSLSFSDYTFNFDMHRNASDYQTGGVFSKKVSPAQAKYATNEQKLLRIIKTLKYPRTMLFG